jgi:hypothetical protein
MKQMGRIIGKKNVSTYLLPQEYANLASRGRLLGIDNSEVVVLALQMMMEAPIDALRQKLYPLGNKGRLQPLREYDSATGQVKDYVDPDAWTGGRD